MSAFGGWTGASHYDFDFVSKTTGTHFPYRATLDHGFSYGGAAGVVVNRNVRVELEVAHSRNDFGSYTSVPPTFIGKNVSGSVDVTTAMVNGWFNANWGWINPYIGGGVGVGFADGSLTVSNGAGRQFDGRDTSVALQAGAGVRFPIAPNWELDIGYRQRHLLDTNFPSAITGFTTTNNDFVTHTVQAGVIWKF